jgi:hypothetical protein
MLQNPAVCGGSVHLTAHVECDAACMPVLLSQLGGYVVLHAYYWAFISHLQILQYLEVCVA